MAKARKHGITSTTFENLIVDAGAVYSGAFTDFASPGTLIGATKGGSNFSLEQEIKEMEVDGAQGPVKGSKRFTRLVATLTCNFIELSTGLLNDAIVASTLTADDPAVGWSSLVRDTEIAAGDYLANVTIIAEVRGKTNAAGIVLANALVDQSLEMAFVEKEEMVIPVTFTAHFATDDLDTEPWTLYYPAS